MNESIVQLIQALLDLIQLIQIRQMNTKIDQKNKEVQDTLEVKNRH